MKLRKLIKLLYDDKTIPCDVIDFLNEDYESSSLGFVNYGDIDLVHYIRSNLKYFKNESVIKRNLELKNATILQNKLDDIKNIILDDN
tara:strand:+ start:7928 stop:8191 length:264 start_codon:yes stop_codon:yes gene_type:complete